jgi:hypothetical protein
MSQDDNNGMLNLDEMRGAKTLKVLYQGKEYPIRTVASLSPEEFGQVMAYGTKFSTLTDDQAQINNGEVVMKAVGEMMQIVAPELPKTLSLQENMAVLKFWSENNKQKNSPRAVNTKRKRR